ncbi:MAG TPA: MFS transporter [Magnetospirillaceae bacterium]|jgi:predicted MFS family arabinose efflux permease
MASLPFLSPAFHRLAWSNLAAQSAEQIGLAAAPIVAVLMLGAGASQTGLLQAVQTLPFLLLAIPLGLLADRTPRRRLMLCGEILRVASFIGIIISVEAHMLSVAMLAAFGFVGATGTVACSVSAPSLVPSLVARDGLTAANGRLELVRSVAYAAGPALGGALVGWIGAMAAFAIAALISCGAAVLLGGLKESPRAKLPPRNPIQDIAEGGRFVFAHPLLRPILATAVVFNIAFFVQQAVFVPYAVHALHLSASGVGVTMAAYGGGMLVAALFAGRIMRRLPFGMTIAIGPLTGLCAAIAMAVTIWVPSMAVAMVSFFLIGAGPILWVIGTTTLRQLVTPQRLLGRVSAILTVATFGARPLGAGIGALIGGLYGAPICLLLALAGFGVQALIILASPAVHLKTQPQPVGDLSPAE